MPLDPEEQDGGKKVPQNQRIRLRSQPIVSDRDEDAASQALLEAQNKLLQEITAKIVEKDLASTDAEAFQQAFIQIQNALQGSSPSKMAPDSVAHPTYTFGTPIQGGVAGREYAVRFAGALAPGALISGTGEPEPVYVHMAGMPPIGDPRLPLSDEFKDLLDEIVEETKLDKETVLRQGLVFVSLAQKAKQAGFKLAIVDDDGTIIANIDGF